MFTLILLIMALGLFVGVPVLIYKQGKKNFRLRNLQLKDLEERERQRKNPQQQLPGWYPDENGSQRYWDGRAWTAGPAR